MKTSYSKYSQIFETAIIQVPPVGWEVYDSNIDKMIGEIWRLNCNGSMWAPLIRYTEF